MTDIIALCLDIDAKAAAAGFVTVAPSAACLWCVPRLPAPACSWDDTFTLLDPALAPAG